MNTLYEWLYDNYALTRLQHMDFSDCYQTQEADWNQTLMSLAPSVQLQASDWLSCVQIHWGTEAFRLGVEFGLALKNNIT